MNHPARPDIGAGRRASRAESCPLCRSEATELFSKDVRRDYHRCSQCSLIFVPPAMRLALEDQALRYAKHENRRDDPGYVQFLLRLAHPLSVRLSPGAIGLDFGCGPVPLLGDLLTQMGFPTRSYDPIFAPHDALLDEQYDFITCCEVIEHVHEPNETLARLARMLRPAGTLAVMTRFYTPESPFDTWWYRRDLTHVCFYSAETMRWIAQQHGWSIVLPSDNVALFGAPT
jgi:hypothetical protein